MTERLVRNEELLRRSKVYSWDRITKYTPRNIRPTDVEGAIEVAGYFMFFEFKEYGVEIPTGQRLFFERMLLRHGWRGCLLVCEHAPLRTLEPMADVQAVSVWMWDEQERRICKTDRMEIAREEDFGWWIQQWCDHASQRPNHFITTFRRRAGVYPEPAATRS